MEIKTILAPFTGRAEETSALEMALQLAKRNSGYVEALHVMPDLNASGGYAMPEYIPQETIGHFMEAYRIAREKAEKVFREAVERNGIKLAASEDNAEGASAWFNADDGYIETAVGNRSRLADLVVASRPQDHADSVEAVYGALFKGGRPVLLVPPGTDLPALRERALIAWNGSLEAARAIAFALPMLRRYKLWVFTARDKDSAPFPVSAEELVRFIKRHGLHADILDHDTSGYEASELLEKAADTLDAGLIVMGAYSHSRLKETVLGGMTRTMLHNAKRPVLMAH